MAREDDRGDSERYSNVLFPVLGPELFRTLKWNLFYILPLQQTSTL